MCVCHLFVNVCVGVVYLALSRKLPFKSPQLVAYKGRASKINILIISWILVSAPDVGRESTRSLETEVIFVRNRNVDIRATSHNSFAFCSESHWRFCSIGSVCKGLCYMEINIQRGTVNSMKQAKRIKLCTRQDTCSQKHSVDSSDHPCEDS